ncbi:hypothetical protein H9657_09925 [Cellulomonas sp. Sa3CUA2]|uniref:Uncharacterized protein n=1 Tax=Cellulomonas avistercoris TaxID=2762242 RepID=A0ABR8QDT2_9CELL|nr:hypothetical protein [Cellulomonas avistercoris]MBD7918590.1 hypothetical protein [Cellulomonas avistercoris]
MQIKRVLAGAAVALLTGVMLTATAGSASAACDCGTGSYVGQRAYQGVGNNISVYRWNGGGWTYLGRYVVQ